MVFDDTVKLCYTYYIGTRLTFLGYLLRFILKSSANTHKEIDAISRAITASWSLADVQVDPPKEWGLEAYTEDEDEGWCSTGELASKLKELAGQL